MNDSRGVNPAVELEILRKAGEVGKSGFQQHPDGIFGCDARNDEYRYIEVRGPKGCPLSRARLPYDDDPLTVGVMINVSSVTGRTGPILFIIECIGDWDCDEGSRACGSSGLILSVSQGFGYRVVIDPSTAAHRYYRACGRDMNSTGRQDCYFIPVDDFERIY